MLPILREPALQDPFRASLLPVLCQCSRSHTREHSLIAFFVLRSTCSAPQHDSVLESREGSTEDKGSGPATLFSSPPEALSLELAIDSLFVARQMPADDGFCVPIHLPITTTY